MRRSTALFLMLTAALLTGCRAGTQSGPPQGGPPTHLAEKPGALPSDIAPTRSTGTDGSGVGSGSPEPGATGGSGNGGGGAGAVSPFRTIGSLTDADGDAGLGAPAYADLLRIRIQDNGHSARVLIDVGGAVPDPMPAGEQMGVGVDLYKRRTAESDYQLYAQGSEDGWFAYLATPKGLVEYPGSFGLGGGRLAFTVPWTSLGNIMGKHFSAYLDWDKERPVLNEVAADRAPRSGTDTFSR